jgi:ABC-type sugar transport system substrate-binding protein
MEQLAKEMGGKGVVAILAGNQNAPNLQKRVQGVKEVYEWGTTSVDLLYAKAAENKNPPASFVKGQLIPVTKDNVDDYAKNWDKWLPKK